MNQVNHILRSRASLKPNSNEDQKMEAEGGCGVVGLAAESPIAGKHLLQALIQMQNRGNGKGGGISAVGMDPTFFGVSQDTLDNYYLLAIAYLDISIQNDLEEKYIKNKFQIAKSGKFPSVENYSKIGLEVEPPTVVYYFVKPKSEIIKEFCELHEITDITKGTDEFVYQNSYKLNKEFYTSFGKQKAFVLSHGKNLIVLKLVGFGDQVISYYKLEDFKAFIWIGHHRYPTKGKVWHPGGAHPFIGLNEALVHNGDFANYHAISEYLAQRNIYSLFLTDTEVAAYLFDLYCRIYEYPTEYLLEALAPTTERDFKLLPKDKQVIYREIQKSHLHASPDGPWFFIISRNLVKEGSYQLLGITDTSMLRPQVFALQEGEVKIGLVASEKQGIDAILRSLSADDSRFSSKADYYWNARGGSYTDGGAFAFNVKNEGKKAFLECQDKFGNPITVRKNDIITDGLQEFIEKQYEIKNSEIIINESIETDNIVSFVLDLVQSGKNSENILRYVDYLTLLLDRLHLYPNHYNGKYRSVLEDGINSLCRFLPHSVTEINKKYLYVNYETINELPKPLTPESKLVLDVKDFPVEGEKSAAIAIVKAYELGWTHIYSIDWRGQRFCGSGLGPESNKLRIEVYGCPGDYLASGLDGAQIYVHASVQDQVANMMKSGTLVIYGDVGQTFMYGAKGGEVYVLGDCAGRPLINAVGNPKVVINGTALDYLAESFMAGDPLKNGGFVVVNALQFSSDGIAEPLDEPYPGGNLLSLASGGAIYVNDPLSKITDDQLHGGAFSHFSDEDWKILQPYLEKNSRLFNIPSFLNESSLYRKVIPIRGFLSH